MPTEMKPRPISPAVARARWVLPQPGGPNSRIPPPAVLPYAAYSSACSTGAMIFEADVLLDGLHATDVGEPDLRPLDVDRVLALVLLPADPDAFSLRWVARGSVLGAGAAIGRRRRRPRRPGRSAARLRALGADPALDRSTETEGPRPRRVAKPRSASPGSRSIARRYAAVASAALPSSSRRCALRRERLGRLATAVQQVLDGHERRRALAARGIGARQSEERGLVLGRSTQDLAEFGGGLVGRAIEQGAREHAAKLQVVRRDAHGLAERVGTGATDGGVPDTGGRIANAHRAETMTMVTGPRCPAPTAPSQPSGASSSRA